MKVAPYARVSTKDKGQDPENQLEGDYDSVDLVIISILSNHDVHLTAKTIVKFAWQDHGIVLTTMQVAKHMSHLQVEVYRSDGRRGKCTYMIHLEEFRS